MRTIKFRGELVESGEYVYGYFWVDRDGKKRIANSTSPNHEVEKVAQLVGYDRNGHEVYEGDRIRHPHGTIGYEADMRHIYSVKYEELVENEGL